MTTYKDNDLREALRRKYNDTPQLPADFMKRMQKSTPKPTRRARHIYIAALAAAACIALVVMMVWPTNGSPVLTGGQAPCEASLTEGLSPCELSDTKEIIRHADTENRVLPVKAVVHQAKKTDRQLVEQPNTEPTTDSLDYYINKIEHELAQVDDSLYIERIHRVMHADERLQRIVNNYILNELHKDAQPHQAAIINNVTTDEE